MTKHKNQLIIKRIPPFRDQRKRPSLQPSVGPKSRVKKEKWKTTKSPNQTSKHTVATQISSISFPSVHVCATVLQVQFCLNVSIHILGSFIFFLCFVTKVLGANARGVEQCCEIFWKYIFKFIVYYSFGDLCQNEKLKRIDLNNLTCNHILIRSTFQKCLTKKNSFFKLLFDKR